MYFSRILFFSVILVAPYSVYSMTQERSPALVKMVRELEEDASKIRQYSLGELTLLLASEEAQQIKFNGSFSIEWTLPSWVLCRICSKMALKDYERSPCELIFGNGSETPQRLLLCKVILQDTHSMNEYESGNLIKKFPGLFLKPLKECFPTASEKHIQTLLEAYPQAGPELVPVIIKHIASVSEHYISKLLTCISQANQKEITMALSEHLKQEINNNLELYTEQELKEKISQGALRGLYLISVFFEKSPSLASYFLPLLKEHWTLLPSSWTDTIAHKSTDELKEHLIEIIAEHVEKIDHRAFRYLLKEFKPHQISFLVQQIIPKIQAIEPIKLTYLLDEHPQTAEMLRSALSSFIKTSHTFETLSSVEEFLSEDSYHSLYTMATSLTNSESSQTRSQTEGYLARKRALVRLLYGKDGITQHKQYALTKDPEVMALLNQLHESERKLRAEGFYVFVTGQPKVYHFFIDCYTQLWRLKAGQSLDGQLLVPTTQGSDIFLNGGIFNNFQQQLECSLYYFLLNTCEYGGNLDLDTVFEAFNLKKQYDTYREEFDQLEKLHEKALGKYGNFLQIGLNKELVRKYIETCYPGGYDAKVSVNGNITRDAVLILDMLAKEPHCIKSMEGIIFCLKQHDLAKLQPNPGIKIYSFNVKDSQAWQEYTHMRDTLLKKIINE
jgi:hypothetical protein